MGDRGITSTDALPEALEAAVAKAVSDIAAQVDGSLARQLAQAVKLLKLGGLLDEKDLEGDAIREFQAGCRAAIAGKHRVRHWATHSHTVPSITHAPANPNLAPERVPIFAPLPH